MPQIIASTYEIIQQIGAGGAGVVYLAKHLRLGKYVVLKADKRTLMAKPEVLRREVDALKNLSHTYIPQVYDFIVENDTVYTVMDFIEGESLDKPLKQDKRFQQADIVAWACQLLDALDYLHTRPPHGILHGDIKPANIMLTPQGDIRLIDFNIALALGEEGAVRAGFSRGYASPEHYGIDYSSISATQMDTDVETKVAIESPETLLTNRCQSKSYSGTSGRQSVLLDVRSDIYSLGATLYHLLTGKRPEQNAKEVLTITDSAVSHAVVRIIEKAMAPDPNARYQSAAEMLYDFQHLHQNDPRTRKHKRRARIGAVLLSVLFLAGGATSLAGARQMEREQEVARIAAEQAEQEERAAKEAEQAAKEAEQAAKMALEAISVSQWALREGDLTRATTSALEALALETPYQSQAQYALTNALGVYDLKDGYKPYLKIDLPSEPMKTVLSPMGTKAAVLIHEQVLVFDTEAGSQIASMKTETSALSDAVFVDEELLVFAGEGALTALDLKSGQVLWKGRAATGITLSEDGSTVAAVYKDENIAAIYDAASGVPLRTVTFHTGQQNVTANDIFADPEDDLFSLDADGTHLAISFAGGGLTVFDLKDQAGDLTVFESSEYTRFQGGFHGQYLAFSAMGAEQSIFVVLDVLSAAQTGGFASTMPFYAMADESGVYVSTEDILVKIDPVSGEQTEVAYTDSDINRYTKNESYTMVALKDGTCAFFDKNAVQISKCAECKRCDFVDLAGDCAITACRDTPTLWLYRLENHSEKQIFTYDAEFLHNEARISADKSTVMLFRYDSFRLYSANGTVLTEVMLPDAQEVYDQQYQRDEAGSRLDVIYNDGLIRTYSAEDGRLLSEVYGEKPDETLYEDFMTKHFKVTSPLHGTPAIYDLQTGEKIRDLEADDYLAYVTELDSYLITEYITAQGERYGLLLDKTCEVLAYLPNLSDILADGTLIFDDMWGNLRESRIYSIQELIALANN